LYATNISAAASTRSGAGHGDDCRYKITPALRRQVVCRSVSQAL
jgi:hypothetical protein